MMSARFARFKKLFAPRFAEEPRFGEFLVQINFGLFFSHSDYHSPHSRSHSLSVILSVTRLLDESRREMI